MEKIDFTGILNSVKKYSENIPKCKVCGDIIVDGMCYSCEDRERKRIENEKRDVERLGGIRAYKDFTLEKYDNIKLKSIIKYPENLYLYGPAGVGKTHLATALVRQYPDGIVVKPTQIIDKFRNINSEYEKRDLIRYFVDKNHIVIDDIGIEYINDYTYQFIYSIIDGRWNNYKTGLIITSNLSLDDLKAKVNDDRLTSRIKGMCKVIKIDGKDRRVGK